MNQPVAEKRIGGEVTVGSILADDAFARAIANECIESGKVRMAQ